MNNDIVLDYSDVEFHDFGQNLYGVDGWKSPAILLNKKLAIEIGWFENDSSETNPQFAVKLGPNLVMELRGDTLPPSSDIKTKFNQNGVILQPHNTKKPTGLFLEIQMGP